MRLSPLGIAAAVTLAAFGMAYSSGPSRSAGDRTGSPLNTTQQKCGTCHSGGNFNPETTIALFRDGERVFDYAPGATHTLRVSVAADNSPAGYGYQVVALTPDLENAGSYGTAPDDFRVADIAGRSYLEHRRLQAADSVEVEWVAPDAGTGDVTIYAAGNAVNGANGSAGDNVDEDVLTLPEAQSSSTRAALDASLWRVATPGDGAVVVRAEAAFGAQAEVRIVDTDGRLLRTAELIDGRAELRDVGARARIRPVVVQLVTPDKRTGSRMITLR